jgi:hypothetical protein
VVTLQRSKTDQETDGIVKAIPYGAGGASCPATALRAWLNVADMASGPVIRSITKRSMWHSPMTTDTFDRYHVTIGGFSWHVNEGRFLKSSSVRL